MAQELLTKLPGGMLRYHYTPDDDAAHEIDVFMLAEVPAPYRQRFRAEIEDQNWIVEYGRRLSDAPFRADFVICTADAAI